MLRYISGTVSLLLSVTHRLPRLVGQRDQSCTAYRLQQTHKQGFLVSISSYSLNYSIFVQSITGIPSTHLAMYPVCIQEPESNESVFSYIADIIFEDSHARTAFSTQTIAVVKPHNSTMTMLNQPCQYAPVTLVSICDRSTHSGVPVTCDRYACFICYDRTCSWQGYHKFKYKSSHSYQQNCSR